MPRCVSLVHRTLRAPRKFASEGPYVHDTIHRFERNFPCFYCPQKLRSEHGRTQHILKTAHCRQAEEREFGAEILPGLARGVDDRRALKVLGLTLDDTTQDQSPCISPAELPAECQSPACPSPPPAIAQTPPPPIIRPGGNAKLEYDAKRQLFVEHFPDPRAGAPINNNVDETPDLGAYMASIGNLGDPDWFDTGELLLTTGLTNAGRDEHLQSRLYKGQTPWKTNKSLMADVDRLPHGPEWDAFDIDLNVPAQRAPGKHRSYLFMRPIMDTILDLLANAEFKDYMDYAPKRLWTAEDRKCQVYGEPSSGDWWWRMQVRLPDKSGTIVPLIIASDRTTLSSMAGGQEAYPLYISLANIAKSVRRKTSTGATALLAYLPVDKFGHMPEDQRAGLRRELTHRAMEKVVEELRVASKEGVVALCPDGRYRKAYPIVAATVYDWKEQCTMASIVESGCPKCKQAYRGRGSYGERVPPRTNRETLCAMHACLEDDDRSKINELGLHPVWPWWANLPYTNFAASLMPDILHQLHQGLIKTHLVKWIYAAAGEDQVDQYFALMPTAEGMRHFNRGISKLHQWTGRESKEVEKQLLPVVASLDPQGWDQDIVRLARAILDFTYRAQASRMTEDDVARLENTLAEIHQLKNVLVRIGVYKSHKRFDKIPKLHMVGHMPSDIREMGTPDGFSTEGPEHLHINSKRAWRASNKVRPTPQMIKFLQRHEAIRIHRARMNAYLGRFIIDGPRRRKCRVIYEDEEEPAFEPGWQVPVGHVATGYAAGGLDENDEGVDGTGDDIGEGDIGKGGEDDNDEGEDEDQVHFSGRMATATDARRHVVYPNPTLSLALKPTAGRVKGLSIIANYGCSDFVHALHVYLRKHATRQNLPANFLPTAHHDYPVWHRLYLRHEALPFDPEWPRRDVIRARPASEDLESAFDVALILDRRHEFGIHRYRAGRVRAIFSLPPTLQFLCPHPLVYVELFTSFSSTLSPFHGMHSLSHLRHFDGRRRAAVLSIFDLAAACHLAPQFRRLDPDLDLASFPDMLTASRYFWLNHYYNRFIYRLIDHWRFAQDASARD
ncbi:hypothetical protein FRC08_015318 [Ceratobasidium sp. 394]|nr:hypothetical protein FRC08_015318 [Ceratobasidium sp. 394]